MMTMMTSMTIIDLTNGGLINNSWILH